MVCGCEAVQTLLALSREEPEEAVPPLSTLATSLLKGLAMVLSYLLKQGQKYADDYRSVISEYTGSMLRLLTTGCHS